MGKHLEKLEFPCQSSWSSIWIYLPAELTRAFKGSISLPVRNADSAWSEVSLGHFSQQKVPYPRKQITLWSSVLLRPDFQCHLWGQILQEGFPVWDLGRQLLLKWALTAMCCVGIRCGLNPPGWHYNYTAAPSLLPPSSGIGRIK